jgi:ferric-dicitrate binding protein FerR (iron transport regulator)
MQAVQAQDHQSVQPIVDTLRRHTSEFRRVTDILVLCEALQRRDALHQAPVAALIRPQQQLLHSFPSSFVMVTRILVIGKWLLSDMVWSPILEDAHFPLFVKSALAVQSFF